MRKIPLVKGEIYHIYNRGVDKRSIVSDENDSDRFVQSIEEFNSLNSIGSIYENSFRKKKDQENLVAILAFCLNTNHYHFLLKPLVDGGVEKFMQRLGTGYTMYFNKKNKRSGALFQGRFKSKHVDSNEYLLRLAAYVSRNDEVHYQLGGPTSKLIRRSFETSLGNKKDFDFIESELITSQFKTKEIYKAFTDEALLDIRNNKDLKREVEDL